VYYVYIIKCKDGSLYTGITTNLERRVEEHNSSKKGAKYTAARRPVTMVFNMECLDRSRASQLEHQIKKMTKSSKLELIDNFKAKKMSLKELQTELRALADVKKAKLLAGFFKTSKGQYGYGDIFLGITVPQIRLLVKRYCELELKDVLKLLKSKLHEERLCALLIMVAKFEKGNEESRAEIFKAYLKNSKHVNNWDLVDSSADKIVGAYLYDKKPDILFKLVDSEMLWERRIAMLATFHHIKQGQAALAFLIAEKLLRDREDLMHKAVGWMLREIGKRCSQNAEEEFLKKHYFKLSRTTLRYAIERFEQSKRLKYLNGEFH
jgi:3-methyladenine DNA glycosylase AlkD/predicted GIY-YIG superfamily endonuclease